MGTASQLGTAGLEARETKKGGESEKESKPRRVWAGHC